MDKEYAPYSKRFGTGFSKLPCAKKLSLIMNNILSSANWKQREKQLSQAYYLIAKQHNTLKITKSLPAEVSRFHKRPYLVIHGDIFANEIKKKIKSKIIKNIKSDIGSVNQITNTIDLLENDALLKKMKNLYK